MIRPGVTDILTSSHLMSGQDLAQRKTQHGLISVADEACSVLPRGALERGCVYQCTGSGASSLVWLLVARAVSDGSWLALVDLPHAGLLSAREYGIALERLLCVDTSRVATHWLRMMGALVDGIDVVVTASPRCSAADARKLVTRIKAQSAVLFVIGDTRDFPVDITLRIASSRWMFSGHARQREVTVATEGRRVYGMQPQKMLLPQLSEHFLQVSC
ncbi:MAG: hypothetical protein EXQ63_03950 [Ilumatobacteraceae bacterium]|nr:hypothetical protein [Ilumatobacteraceae bacterium]